MKIMVIKPGEKPKPATIRDGSRDTLFDLQHIVGGYVEQVDTQKLRHKMNALLVDEDGIFKRKAPNSYAQMESAYPGMLVGTAVLIGLRPTDDGLEWTDYHD